MDEKVLTRKELYELVWSTPIQRLAKDLCLSDVGLAKLCRRNDIPVPGRGYWRRLETGHKVKVIALPFAKGNSDSTITFYPSRKPPEPDTAIDVIPTTTITVDDSRPISHPLAIRTKKLLKTAKADDHGLLQSHRGDVSHLLVSSHLLGRALTALDALLRGVEENGLAVEWPKDGHLRLRVDERVLTFRIDEITHKRDHQKTELEIKRKTPDWQLPRWDYELTGRLRLTIDQGAGAGARHSWADGKQQRVENCLTSFVAGLRAVAGALRAAEEERERWHREWEEKRRRAEEEERNRQREIRRGDLIVKAANERRQATLIREFILAATRAASSCDQETEVRLVRLLEWAKDYVNRVDPLNRLQQLLNEFEPE